MGVGERRRSRLEVEVKSKPAGGSAARGWRPIQNVDTSAPVTTRLLACFSTLARGDILESAAFVWPCSKCGLFPRRMTHNAARSHLSPRIIWCPFTEHPLGNGARVNAPKKAQLSKGRREARRDSPAPKASGCPRPQAEPRSGRKGPSYAER